MSWATSKINNIAEVVTKGTTPTTYGMPFVDSGVNFIKAEALNGDSALDSSGFAFVSESTHEKLKRSILAEGDILITIAGAQVGRCGIVRPEHLPANTNQAVGIIRVHRKRANPGFVYYFFKNPQTFQMCQGIGSQAAQPNINLTVLKGFDLPLPDLRTQDALVEILSAYDDLIKNNQRRIALLEEAARLLYREWFVHFRFPGHEHVSIIDGLPEGWERQPISGLADIFRGKSYRSSELVDSDGQPFINLKCVNRFGGFRISGMKWFRGKHKELHLTVPGDVLIAVTDMTRNAMIVAQAARVPMTVGDNAIYSMDLVKAIPKTDVEPEWFYGMLRFSQFSAVVREEATGATVLHLKPRHLENWEAVVPPPPLRGLFSEQFGAILQQVDNLEVQSANCAQARDLLLPRLMNGEIAV